jgi:hypothetical protein
MDKGKLALSESYQGKWRIVWVFGEEDGGVLGQSEEDGVEPCPAFRPGDGETLTAQEDWEHWTASNAVMTLSFTHRDEIGFFWDSDKKARKALGIAKKAMKQERPMPEWALTALANGWKAPKNWKP